MLKDVEAFAPSYDYELSFFLSFAVPRGKKGGDGVAIIVCALLLAPQGGGGIVLIGGVKEGY